METKIIDLLKTKLKNIGSTEKVSNLDYRKGSSLFMNGQSQMLT